MKILIDMNLSPAWAVFLQSHGHEAAHWTAIGQADAPDRDLMNYARQHDQVVLTYDLDFGAILAASGQSQPSVIQIRDGDNSPLALGPQLIIVLDQLAVELHQGALLTISAKRHKVTLLPLPKR